MDKIFENTVPLSRGVNLRNLLSSEGEFQVDLDFNPAQNGMDLMNDDNIIVDDADESDSEDVYNHLEEKTQKMMLDSPEYHSFEELEKKMVECPITNLPSGSIKILIMEEGNGPLVPSDAEVTIHYAAYWEKAKIPFDSTLTMNSGVPMRIRLGAGKFLAGLEVALARARGPAARLLALLRPAAAWGERGAPPRIPPQRALFVIALYAVHEVASALRFNDLPSEEQSKFETTVRTVQAIRNQSKDLFAQKKFHRAIANYQRACSVLTISRPEDEAQEAELKDLRLKIILNLAICYYKLEKPKQILKMLDFADTIVDVRKSVKALFYYGRAYQLLGQTERAIDYYKSALKLEPKNKEIGATLFELDVRSKRSAEKEQLMWQRALNSAPATKKVTYTVDENFESEVREVCEHLMGCVGFAKIDLPGGLSCDEVLCVRTVAGQFDGKLIVACDEKGKHKKIAIIKKD